MTRRIAKTQKRQYIYIFSVLFGLIFIRYCYFGLTYYNQLDDYIQYHNYTAYHDELWALIKSLGLLSARPLAGLSDLFLWSKFYSVMIAAAAVISALYAVSAVLLHKVFHKRFGTGFLFYVFYALLPLGFEGAYWISASSRIVVGLFFAALSFYFFDLWFDSGRKRDLVLFAVFQFVAFCYYEQIILLSGALTLILMLCGLKNPGWHRLRWGFLTAGNAAVYLAVTKLMPAGVYGQRAQLFLPWQEGYTERVLDPLLTQLQTAYLEGFSSTLGKGFVRGLQFLVTEPNVIWALLALFLCFMFFILIRQDNRESIRFFAELFAGLFLAIIPVALFFVLKEPWFGLRNTVTSFCGLALVFDALFDLFFGRLKSGRAVEAGLVAAFALVCCIASISELHDYRETTIADTKIAMLTADTFADTTFADDTEIWLLNVDPSYVSNGNLYYHEHDTGVTSSAWALTGAIRAVSNRPDAFSDVVFTPVSSKLPLLAAESAVEKANTWWYTGENLVPISLVKWGSNTWKAVNSSGTVLGILAYADGTLTFSVS